MLWKQLWLLFMHPEKFLGQLGYEELIFDKRNALWALSELFWLHFHVFLQDLKQRIGKNVSFECKTALRIWRKIFTSLHFGVSNFEKRVLRHIKRCLGSLLWSVWCPKTFSEFRMVTKMGYRITKSFWKVDLKLPNGIFQNFVSLEETALRAAFWDVSGDSNGVFKAICPILNWFLFRPKSHFWKEYIILNF